MHSPGGAARITIPVYAIALPEVLRLRCPRIVSPRAPRVAFRVPHSKLPAAVGRILQWPDNLSAGSHGSRINRIGVRNHDVRTTRLDPAEFMRRPETAAILIVLAGAKHDHPASQCQFGVGNGSVFALIHRVAFEAKDILQPLDCRRRVAVTMTGNNGAPGVSHGILRGQISAQARRRTTGSGILGGMALPAGDQVLVQIVDAALADVAHRAGAWLVCRPGCTQCCYGAFAINQLDALRLAAGMETLRGESPSMAAEIERRATEWICEHGPGFPGDPQTGRLGDTDADRARFEDYANDAACPALNPSTGHCDVYEWRPMTCRVFGPPVQVDAGPEADTNAAKALAHCELCFAGASANEIAACEMPIPHELEGNLLQAIPAQPETVVAFALLR